MKSCFTAYMLWDKGIKFVAAAQLLKKIILEKSFSFVGWSI
jgi:hypothetical protein